MLPGPMFRSISPTWFWEAVFRQYSLGSGSQSRDFAKNGLFTRPGGLSMSKLNAARQAASFGEISDQTDAGRG